MENKAKGTKDYFGEESLKLQKIIKIIEKVSNKYSIERVFTPTFEKTSLFLKAVGYETDVANKEMYTFEDRKGRNLTLKPEGTSSVVRMILENKILDSNKILDYFYIDSMFRYERPQKGRQREFFQYGVERFGRNDVFTDVETINIAIDILNELKINDYELQINSIGNSQDRNNYNNYLKDFLKDKIKNMSKYSIEKYNSGNILKILDSKEEKDKEFLNNFPKIINFINKESKLRFEKTINLLNKFNIKYVINNNLVRGLDYYNDLVFEFVSTDLKTLGAKSTLIGGGSYDYLINKLDNKKNIPAIGFAAGLERLILASKEINSKNLNKDIDYYISVAYQEDEMLTKAIDISKKLREKYNVYTDFSKRKFDKKYQFAKKINSKNIIIIGNEIKEDKIIINNVLENKKVKKTIKELINE